MALPPEVEALRAEVQALYDETHASITRQLADLLADPLDTAANRRRLLTRLRKLDRTVERLTENLDRDMRAWANRSLAVVYQAGAEEAASVVGRGFTWNQVDVDVVANLARTAMDDLLAATRFMRRDAKRLIRLAARESARLVVLEGATLQRAARQMARTLEQHGIKAVRYRNGARHDLADYSDTVVRTTTAQLYNRAFLGGLANGGVGFTQCVDGPACGFTTHDDSDLANGSIRTIADAIAYPIAHPRCARSWSARPDITTPEEAARGARFSAEEQQRRANEERVRERQAERSRRATRARRQRRQRSVR